MMNKHQRWVVALGLLPVASFLITIAFLWDHFQSNPQLGGNSFAEIALMSVYGTIQLFNIEQALDAHGLLWYQILRVVCPLTVFISGVAIIAHIKREWIWFRALFHSCRRPVVVCGLGNLGLSIASHFREKHRPVIGITKDPSSISAVLARDAGVLVIAGDASDPEILRRVRITRAYSIHVACLDDSDSARIGSAIIDSLSSSSKEGGGSRRIPRVLVHIRNPRLRFLLQDRELRQWKRGTPFVEYFSILEAGACGLLEEMEKADLLSSSDIHLEGQTDFSESLILRLASRTSAQKPDAHPDVRLFLHDKEAESWCGSLLVDYKHLECRFSIVPVPEKKDTSCLCDDTLAVGNRKHVRVVCPVDLDDETGSLRSALEHDWRMRMEESKCPVYMVLWSDKVASRLVRSDSRKEGAGVIPFGLIEYFTRPGVLESTETEEIAKAIWHDYMSNYSKTDEWEDLDEEQKENNREPARCTCSQLLNLDLYLVRDGRFAPPEMCVTPSELETLSEQEHTRWMEQKHYQGYRYAPKRRDSKLRFLRRHPCLVPYAHLSPEEQEKDRATWRTRLQLLSSLGYAIVRPSEKDPVRLHR